MSSEGREVFLDSNGPEVRHLRAVDPVMNEILGSMDINAVSYKIESCAFEALAGSIASQFLSFKAAAAIWARVRALTGATPEGFAGTSDEALRVAGLSYVKISALKSLAAKIMYEEIDLSILPAMSDEDVIAELVKLKGIGSWTAEMFLIFSLGRPDVFSWRDVGLVRAIEFFYKMPARPDAKEVEEISEPWRPYRTTAAIILWEAIHLGMVK